MIENRIQAHCRTRGPEQSAEGPAMYPDAILNVAHHREKNVQLPRTEVRAIQQNPSYSAKNNVAMRLIATFMPNSTYLAKNIHICYSFVIILKVLTFIEN